MGLNFYKKITDKIFSKNIFLTNVIYLYTFKDNIDKEKMRTIIHYEHY